ncbi:MauE/DoxX family redox-associated membrane protein [Pedobacter foliorum]|uniref:MauE/DoxX family redox-associated membrane protein n=1 Tax=Pedobacter foliorum TaxID=2739058 RepID=UPI0015678C11|nr:MauE/DoxX family redox-associated membrane protein [Pedobacter foliorum]NRF41121.1 hypothetical protein [Pedobacter foliorum]
MKSTTRSHPSLGLARIRQSLIDVICYCFILLFLYAAAAKLLDYRKFELQISKSPILTDFAGVLAWLVPVAEILIAILLLISKTTSLGLFAALGLMSLFTAYIIAILNFSENIPCSCGGVLAHMSWKQHLVFNVAFVALAVTGILMQPKPKK